MIGSTRSIRRAPWLAVLVVAVAFASRADAAGPLEDSVRTAPDSLAHQLRAPGAISRLMAHQDSVVKAQGGPKADNAQLYLSFLPGRVGKTFTGFTSQLYFHATGSDTLGAWWHLEGKGGENAGALRVEWAGVPGFGWKQPFPVTGQGFVLLDRTPQSARLRMVFAVPYEAAGPVVADSVYSLCRVIFKHRPGRDLAGCERPVCIEWSKATLAFGAKDEPEVSRGERFVAFAGPYAICEPFKGPRVAAWKPPKTATATPPK